MALKILLAVLVLVVGFAAYVRMAPVPEDRLTAKPGPMEPGTYPLKGGIKVVRPLDTLPQAAMAQLLDIAQNTPRTERIGEGTDPVAFITRTKLMRFPDVTVIWEEGGNLHIHAHLVIGQSDLGVNAARVIGWLDQLEAS